MRRSLRKLIITLVLAVAALAALLYKFRNSLAGGAFHWSVLGNSWRHANPYLLLLGVVSTYVAYLIRAFRWKRMSRYLGPSKIASLYSATLMGFACLVILGRAGEPIRPLLIARKEKLPISGMFGVYLLERALDVGATAVFAGLALIAISRRGLTAASGIPLVHAMQAGGALFLVAFAVLTAFLVYFRLHGAGVVARRFEQSVLEGKNRTGWRAKIAALIAGLSEGLHALRTWGDLGAAVAWTAAHWILVVYIYVWLAHAFGGRLAALTFSGAMLVLASTMVGSALQLPVGGGGAQVATFLVFTVIFGVEDEPAAAAAISIWLITFASSILVGVPLLLREGWSMGELRRVASAEREAVVLEAEEHMAQEHPAKGAREENGGAKGDARL